MVVGKIESGQNIQAEFKYSLILSTLLYAAKSWPIIALTILILMSNNMKKLEAAHHKWQRKILGITWQDRVANDEVRRRTGMLKLEYIIRKRRRRWLGQLSDEQRQNLEAGPELAAVR